MGDRTLTCIECSSEFIFTEGEQEFFQEKDFTDPKRCPTCRKAKKQQRNQNRGRY